MRIKQVIKILQSVKDKDRSLQILIGNEDDDFLASDIFEFMHTDDCEQSVELFIHNDELYKTQ